MAAAYTSRDAVNATLDTVLRHASLSDELREQVVQDNLAGAPQARHDWPTFRLAYGESPYGYLMTRRIERAMALLRRGELSVTEVCFAVGCSSLGTFSSRFAELVGMPPSTYRRHEARATTGMPSCVAKQVTRPIRNREARTPGPQ